MARFKLGEQSATLAYGALAILLVALFIIYPSDTFQSSLAGLRLWWTLVFPALLPFLILTEILSGLGVLQAIGVLFRPFARLFFGMPGSAGWVIATGLTAGYPAGAVLTARITAKGELAAKDAQRLLNLSHLCNPLVMVTVVGAGFLGSIKAGLFIALVHYLSAAVSSLIMRLVPTRTQSNIPLHETKGSEKRLNFFQVLEKSRKEDGRAFGKLLGDAVSKANETLMALAGFIIIFSVLAKLSLILLLPSGISNTVQNLLPGMLEPHLGGQAAARLTLDFTTVCASIGAILAWSGFSLHAQVMGLIHRTGVRYGPFLAGRLLHASAAFFLSFVLANPLSQWLERAQMSFGRLSASPIANLTAASQLHRVWMSAGWTMGLFAAGLVLMLLLSGVAMCLKPFLKRSA
ncbi:nucleoside recognition domain-containing protein [Gorillibacterium massiliense]|uniref:nucleoside recognition domain-containing protein n=1 Tax=Gorillibacterium massiliense TaxID=1280390 RepID=UPI0004AE1ABE|nr:nucleoside recognition domain-containing protein [Gorillibacterium massiliense]